MHGVLTSLRSSRLRSGRECPRSRTSDAANARSMDALLSRWLGLAVSMLTLYGIAPGDRVIAARALRAAGRETAPPQPALLDEHGQAVGIDAVEDRILTVRTVNRATRTVTFTLAGSTLTYRSEADAAQMLYLASSLLEVIASRRHWTRACADARLGQARHCKRFVHADPLIRFSSLV